MSHGFIGIPPNVEAVRRDFDDFVTELESMPSEKVRVLFGFAWGNEIYERDWLELNLTGNELRARVSEAEAAGLGKIGSDDIYITLPALGVERQYCHEADIHVTAADAKHPYVVAERQRWLDKGWKVVPVGGRIGQTLLDRRAPMQIINDHLKLARPRFLCRDVEERVKLTVDLENTIGQPASAKQLANLQRIAGAAFATLAPLYKEFNGLAFHRNGATAGLVVASIGDLKYLNTEWRDWFTDVPAEELYEYQRDGFAFATIACSGNYFVVSKDRIFYSDHDSGDDRPWADTLDGFFARALQDPARFLQEAGCYTRYSDGLTDKQYIPVSFYHE